MTNKRNIRIYFDFACPFCYNEWKFMERVKPNMKDELNIEYYGWELNPQMPKEGMAVNLEKFAKTGKLLNKLGAPVNAKAGDIKHMYNTQKALQILEEAKVLGVAEEYIEKVFNAYFEEQINIADDSVIVEIAKECGINNAKEIIASGKYIDVLKEHDEHCRAIELEYIPAIEEDGKIILMGVLSLEDIEKEFK